MDWFSDRGKFLKSFCINNNLLNFISKPTRVQTNKNGVPSSKIIVAVSSKEGLFSSLCHRTHM